MTSPTFLEMRDRLIAGHAYDPADERDACGVGLVCALDGKPSPRGGRVGDPLP